MLPGIRTNMDIIFCIDTSASMEKYISNVKSKIINICNDLKEKCCNGLKENESQNSSYAKIIIFSNQSEDIFETPFYHLGSASNDFFVKLENLVKISKSNNEQGNKTNSIKALEMAINCKYFHKIYLWTQDQGIITSVDFNVLTDTWYNSNILDKMWKKLWLYTPDMHPWKEIGEFWDNVVLETNPEVNRA